MSGGSRVEDLQEITLGVRLWASVDRPRLAGWVGCALRIEDNVGRRAQDESGDAAARIRAVVSGNLYDN